MEHIRSELTPGNVKLRSIKFPFFHPSLPFPVRLFRTRQNISLMKNSLSAMRKGKLHFTPAKCMRERESERESERERGKKFFITSPSFFPIACWDEIFRGIFNKLNSFWMNFQTKFSL